MNLQCIDSYCESEKTDDHISNAMLQMRSDKRKWFVLPACMTTLASGSFDIIILTELP